MPMIKKFIIQSDEYKCAFAVIRMIRESCESHPFSDNAILDGFENKKVFTKGPDVAEIEKYWRDLSTIYIYEKGDGQSLQQIKDRSTAGYYAMITINTNPPTLGKYHSICFEDFNGINVDYWCPTAGHQTTDEAKFNEKRDNGGGLFEVHYIKKI